MNYSNIAIIGANGFIGNHLASKLLDVPDTNVHLFGKNDKSILGRDNSYYKLNMTDEEQVNDYFSKIDLIYYLASESIPSSSWNNPTFEIEKNLLPFIKFLECIVKLKVKKFVFISSGGTIYGPSDDVLTEDSNKAPFSPHGIIKLTLEYFLNYFRKKNNLNYDIYRVANVYGEGQNTKKGLGVINTFIENILSKNKVDIFGSGENIRNYLYVIDLVEILALSSYTDPEVSGIYNASSNDNLSLNELVQILKKVVTEDFEVAYSDARQSDNSKILLDNSRILKANPGFTFTPLEEGIRNTYLHIKKHLR